MGGKRRRNTAKTGDKGIYKKREEAFNEQQANQKKRDSANDPMYDEIDQFHNQQDFLKLDRDDDDGGASSSEDEIDRQEAVMDLGAAGEESSSSGEDDDEDDSSDEERNILAGQRKSADIASDDEDEEEVVSSDDDAEMMQQMKNNVRDWGRQKKDYYHGDTADLEIGQEEDDALVEEEAAKEIQTARYEQMKEEDFVLSDDDDEQADEDDDDASATKKEITATSVPSRKRLSKQEKIKLIDRKHPELLPLVSHFSNIVSDFTDKTDVVTRALLEGEKGTVQAVGATKSGQQFLLSKALLQASAGLNLAAYLLVKSEQADVEQDVDPAWIQTHPVIKHLQKLNVLSHKLEDKVEAKVPGLGDQMEKLVKASALLSSGEVDVESGDDDDEGGEDNCMDDQGATPTVELTTGVNKEASAATVSSENEDASESDYSEDEIVVSEHAKATNIANEARFGLRSSEVGTAGEQKRNRRPHASDFGDEGAADAEVSKSLAATLNSIEQRSATRKRKPAAAADAIDDANDEDRMRHALDAMEADLGPASDDDGEGGVYDDDEDAFDPEVEGEEADPFYNNMTKKSKAKKEFKKNLYAVKPKYPRMENELPGERPITKTVMKNRGLVPHKNKLNRNPRVKKREQYRKALIRRKGTVREVRTDEGHKYGGESTGIKSNISRSRRLAK